MGDFPRNGVWFSSLRAAEAAKQSRASKLSFLRLHGLPLPKD
jgi:hypothetical protein